MPQVLADTAGICGDQVCTRLAGIGPAACSAVPTGTQYLPDGRLKGVLARVDAVGGTEVREATFGKTGAVAQSSFLGAAAECEGVAADVISAKFSGAAEAR